MVANILPIRPLCNIRAFSGPVHPKPEPIGQKSSTSWWTPLFGWSSDPDYIETSSNNNNNNNKKEESASGKIQTGSGSKSSRFAPGCFTEEKARMLRMLTVETSSSHDMYHSAIASRLATHFKNRPDF